MIKKLLVLFLVMVYVGITQICMAITSFEQLDVQKMQGVIIYLSARLD